MSLSVNKMNDSKEEGKGEDKKEAAGRSLPPLLKTLEETLHNRITQKKV
jgi:hypothetical protein